MKNNIIQFPDLHSSRQTSIKEFNKQIEAAWKAGARRVYSLQRFKNQLLYIGLNKYINAILPLEKENNQPLTSGESGITAPEGAKA